MKKVVNKTINHFVKNVDTYNNAGSTWLIFTETKQWVIELTREKTLWYNYNFFKNVFNYLGLEVVENQHYITQWVEENIINKVKRIDNSNYSLSSSVKDVIENGVKETHSGRDVVDKFIIDTLENGVKETHSGCDLLIDDSIEDAIQNGVKHTIDTTHHKNKYVEDAIINGVKEIHWVEHSNLRSVEDTIQNGVKEIELHKGVRPSSVEDTIQNGVRHTMWSNDDDDVEDAIENGVKKTKRSYESSRRRRTKDTIQNGVKNTYSDFVPQEYDWSNQFDVKEVIENGVKETHDDVYHHKGRVDGVIRNGVKVVIPAFKMIYNPMNFEPVISEEKRIPDVTDVIRDGIKEVQPLPAQDGNRDWGVYYYRKGEPTKPHTKYVDEVIENGIKEN